MAKKALAKTVAPPLGTPSPNPADVRIYTVRGGRVMLDSDLAAVYGVSTSAMNQAVERNDRRFPATFAFRLTDGEWENLKSQFVTSSSVWGGRRKLPRVFTEHGAVMLAAVLNSARAIAASHVVVDTFIRFRRVLDANRTLARKIDDLAHKVDTHDRAIAIIFHELRQLAADAPDAGPDPAQPKGRIGFRPNRERE